MKKLIIVLSCILLFASPVFGAGTYYIDYSSGSDTNPGTKASPWKTAPGMTNQGANRGGPPSGYPTNSYSHAAGDQFIFKGGVTWTGVFPFTISYSGSEGNIDTYTTDHTWYTGASWSQPVMDGGGVCSGIRDYFTVNGKDYWEVNDIKFYGFCNPGSPTTYGIYIEGDSDNWTIDGCTIELYVNRAINVTYTTDIENINVTNNVSDGNCSLVWVEPCATSTATGIYITDNELIDGGASLTGSIHLDGICHFHSNCSGSLFNPLTPLYDVYIARNYVHGNWNKAAGCSGCGWTAFIYNETCSSAKIYNNVIAPDGGNSGAYGEALATYSSCGGHEVDWYNNTIVHTGAATLSAGFITGAYSGSPQIRFRGNILYAPGSNVAMTLHHRSGMSEDIEYNSYYSSSGQFNYVEGNRVSWSTWNNTYGFDDSGSFNQNDPTFVDPPDDVSLQSGSNCIDAFPTAQAPTGTFTTDYDGNTRPSGSAWDIGAYEYDSGSSGSSATGCTIQGGAFK
jgi:hypothetical protein